jgi:predicted secreted hydrolase
MSRALAQTLALVSLVLALAPAHAADGADGFSPVLPGRALVFPADHGAHPSFRTEWWYITGWLGDEAGRERGFQVTFFRSGTGIGLDNPSRFAPTQIIMAHAAIADPRNRHLLHAQRSDRAVAPLAGATASQTRVWIGDWELALVDGEYRSRVDSADFGLDLVLVPPGPPILNGEGGFSRKTPDPRNASYYYSRPHLAVRGTLRLDDREHRVTGEAWLDHEWSSEYLPEEAEGWDWIGINLHDGGSLMAFQMRRPDGSAIWSAGTLRHADGDTEILPPDQVRFRPRRVWESPRSGAEYVIEWDIEIAGRQLALVPLMDDQELDGRRSTGIVYWEGATRLLDGDREIGRGYLEMTGYWQRPSGL